MQSQEINELMAALAKAQGEMSAAAKDSSNPYYNSKYADLNSVWNACRDALSKHGLAVVQTMQNKDGQMVLETTLGHSSGQWMKSYLPINLSKSEDVELDKYGKPKKKNELHLLGSALTYLRRYSLAAIVGVAPDEDDDGNSGGEVYKKSSQQPQQPAAKTDKNASKPVTKLSSEQVSALEAAIGDNDEYRHELFAYFGKQGIKTLNDIPATLFDQLMAAAHKRNEAKKKAFQEEYLEATGA